ncbi:hypothetical protein HOH87_00695 [bacterium]|nr:hypothetical protein [bacterium]
MIHIRQGMVKGALPRPKGADLNEHSISEFLKSDKDFELGGADSDKEDADGAIVPMVDVTRPHNVHMVNGVSTATPSSEGLKLVLPGHLFRPSGQPKATLESLLTKLAGLPDKNHDEATRYISDVLGVMTGEVRKGDEGDLSPIWARVGKEFEEYLCMYSNQTLFNDSMSCSRLIGNFRAFLNVCLEFGKDRKGFVGFLAADGLDFEKYINTDVPGAKFYAQEIILPKLDADTSSPEVGQTLRLAISILHLGYEDIHEASQVFSGLKMAEVADQEIQGVSKELNGLFGLYNAGHFKEIKSRVEEPLFRVVERFVNRVFGLGQYTVMCASLIQFCDENSDLDKWDDTGKAVAVNSEQALMDSLLDVGALVESTNSLMRSPGQVQLASLYDGVPSKELSNFYKFRRKEYDKGVEDTLANIVNVYFENEFGENGHERAIQVLNAFLENQLSVIKDVCNGDATRIAKRSVFFSGRILAKFGELGVPLEDITRLLEEVGVSGGVIAASNQDSKRNEYKEKVGGVINDVVCDYLSMQVARANTKIASHITLAKEAFGADSELLCHQLGSFASRLRALGYEVLCEQVVGSVLLTSAQQSLVLGYSFESDAPEEA